MSGVSLADLLSALTRSVVELVDAPHGLDVPVDSVAFMDIDDLTAEIPPGRALPSLFLQVGITARDAARWLTALGTECPAELRPRAVLTKTGSSSAVRSAARKAGIAVIAVHPQARWEMVHSLLERIMDERPVPPVTTVGPVADSDLFGLAHTAAEATGGLITIEDEQSRVLAYSADSTGAADAVRRLSVLGRQGPAGYLRWLQRRGVADRLRNTGEVIELPAHETWETRRRLAVGIREPAGLGGHPRHTLGTIWVQEADGPLRSDSAEVLLGAASIAARLIWRTRTAPTADALSIQRLFGAHGGEVDIATFVDTFGVAADSRAAVVGFARYPALRGTPADGAIRQAAVTLRLHASAFRQDCLTAVIGDRPYVLFPEYHSADGVASWTRQVIARVEQQSGTTLRAAIAVPVPGLADVARARAEVDRVLDRTTKDPAAESVTTLAQSRTAVLLGEILALITERPHLRDPRIDALIAYDVEYGGALLTSLETYLTHGGDVRAAAAELRIHPNTLRYRVRRAGRISHIDVGNAADRLLLEIQLAALGRQND